MRNDKLRHNLHLHLLVFIAGFTAILGELITIEAFSLVWYRMLIACVIMFVYIRIKQVNIKISIENLMKFLIAGVIIALHWITFFAAIKVSNISIALAMFSTGAFFASFIEPVFNKRKIIGYEIVLGIIVVIGVCLIVNSELRYLNGILLGITSAFLSSLFAVVNGSLVKNNDATVILFYEFIGGVLFISLYLFFSKEGFSKSFFILSVNDWVYLVILASICTAYAFIASVYIMKYISPFTVILTYNLEPVYGIILALLIFGNNELMTNNFYLGALLILLTVIIDALMKNKPNLFKAKR